MELKEFVKQAILDIVGGVEAAQSGLSGMQVIGNSHNGVLKNPPSSIVQDHNGNIYSIVNFDVAVSTVDEARGEGGIKVFSIGAKGEVIGRAETASRIQFATTVRLV